MSIVSRKKNLCLSLASIVLIVVVILGTIGPIPVDAVVTKLAVVFPNGGENITGIVDIQYSIVKEACDDANSTLVFSYTSDSKHGEFHVITEIPIPTDTIAVHSLPWDTSTLPNGTSYRIKIALNPPRKTKDAMSQKDFTIWHPATKNYLLTTHIMPEGAGTISLTPNQTSYTSDETITVTATPITGWVFNHWTGDLTGTLNQTTITMDSNKDITAVFVITTGYTLDTSATIHGSVEKNPDYLTGYDYGTTVTISAHPDIGWQFDHWTGDLAGTSNPSIVTMTSNKTITALFIPLDYTLTILTTGSGTVTKNPNQDTYHYGDTVILTPVPDTGWHFTTWNDEYGTDHPLNITIIENMTLTARFALNDYHLTINTIGHGTVTITPLKEVYHLGDTVQLTATADPGWTFDTWNTDTANTQINITITHNQTITATFTQDEYRLLLHTDPDQAGTITPNPIKETYHYGDNITLTQTPANGYTFNHWNGTETTPTLTIHLTNDTTITAHYDYIEYTLNTTTVGQGIVIVNPNQATYHYGDTVTLTAEPNPGWTFTGWNDNHGTTPTLTITITDNTEITATFTQDHYTLILATDGNGTITKTPDQPTYTYGTSVSLTADPADGWTFKGWSEDYGTANPLTITVTKNTNITAYFTQDHYLLTITIEGNGTVAFSPIPDNDNTPTTFVYGQQIQLTATAGLGWIFNHWTGDAIGSTNPHTITITENTNITAVFTKPAGTHGSSGSLPTAEANGPYYGIITIPITFSAKGSHDNDEGQSRIVKYEWKFTSQDAWKTFSASPTHTYNQSGNYTVSLRVTDDEGQTAVDTTYTIIALANYPPETPIIFGPKNGTVNTQYNFTIITIDPENSPLRYTVQWGDGTYDIHGNQESGVKYTFSHTWRKAGPWIITITVNDGLSETSTTTRMLIDTIAITTIGYLVDVDTDRMYELFETPNGTQIGVNRYDHALYLLDIDGNNLWDHIYDANTFQLTTFKVETPITLQTTLIWITAIVLLAIIMATLFLLANARKKKRIDQNQNHRY